jgi:uncharacterized MAPEG superfamily protein
MAYLRSAAPSTAEAAHAALWLMYRIISLLFYIADKILPA